MNLQEDVDCLDSDDEVLARELERDLKEVCLTTAFLSLNRRLQDDGTGGEYDVLAGFAI